MTATWSSNPPAGIVFDESTLKTHGTTVRNNSANGKINTWYARVEHTVYFKVDVYLSVTSNFKDTSLTIQGLRLVETDTREGSISFGYSDTKYHLNRTRYLTVTDVTHDDTLSINLLKASGTAGSGLTGPTVKYANIVPKSAMKVFTGGEIVEGLVYSHDGAEWCESKGVYAYNENEWCESL